MQDNLDVGVTSVGITLGTTGTDVNVSGSPITTSGNITINIPDASATARGVVTTGTQTFAGYKIFNGTIGANVDIQLATQGTALNTFIKNINATGQTSIGSNGFGFNNANNIYFSGSSKGGGIIAFSNTGNQTYTLQDASGTLAFTSDLSGYVTLGTAQTITAQKTFSTSGSSDTAIINHSSGSGIALNITKGGNGEGLRVTKTSGSGNAVTITGGTLSAEAGQFSGDLQTSTRIAATSGSNAITITPNVGGTQNRIETTGSLPLSLVSAAAITMAAGGTTPQITLATGGAVTLTGALSGTSAVFSSDLTISSTGNAFVVLNNTTPSTGRQWRVSSGSNGILFFTQVGVVDALQLAPSSGAATFSSDVNAGTGFQGRYTRIFEASAQRGGLYPYNIISGAGTDYSIGLFSESSLWFAAGGGITKHLTIASTGAATFSSSVTATQFITGGTPSNTAGFTNSFYAEGNIPSLTLSNTGTNTGKYTLGVTNGNFGIWNNATSSYRLFIDSTGNVGIGTASPTNGLLVINSTASNGVRFALESSGTMNGVVAIGNNAISGLSTTDMALWTRGVMAFETGASGEKMRITSDGYLRLSTSSGGIQFNGDTAAANALDDYEEGTWTMGISFGGASVGVTTSSNTGTYTKIGRKVTVNGILVLSNKGTSTGVVRLTGLPFTPINLDAFYSSISIRVSNVSSNGYIQGYGEVGLNSIRIESVNLLGSRSDLFDNNFINTSDVMISFSYFV
jgi:hypothetical protein